MYLRSIQLQNTGPIKEFVFSMPFENENPKPVILVGQNGSGKSTVLSFIVNALVALKQQVYEDVEVEKGRVYRLRSALGIHGDENFYFAQLKFDLGVSLIEWQLNNEKRAMSDEATPSSLSDSWAKIPENETSYFELPLGELAETHKLESILEKTSLLFFPADRFEPPDWLNVENLSSELRLPDVPRIKGRTQRRIFSRNRLKPTLEWLNAVIFDMMVSEHKSINVPSSMDGNKSSVNARIAVPGKAHSVFNATSLVLQKVLCQKECDTLRLGIGGRNNRVISATIYRDSAAVRVVKDLLSLSAGESALFCLFASIIRDADLSKMIFESPDQIEGVVIIDEADLHLHLNLQFEVLPKLIALFPRVQFIISVHAPLVALGLERELGGCGFEILEMPLGSPITPEDYSEFQVTFEAFAATRTFQHSLLEKIKDGVLPALLVEGKTDAELIAAAWRKLHPKEAIPFEPIPCGVESDPKKRTGGAKQLRNCLEHLSVVTDRAIIAIFDNDKEGCEQFNSLASRSWYSSGLDSSHKKHSMKSIEAILLPPSPGREEFSSAPNHIHRCLEIEHYFSDAFLESRGLKGPPIVAGTSIFEINSDGKVKLADDSDGIDVAEFTAFQTLFDRILSLINDVKG